MNDFPLGTGDCEALLGGVSAGMVLCDAADRVIWANRRFGELVGVEVPSMVGNPIAQVVGKPSETLMDGIERFVIGASAASRRWLECASANHGELALRVFTDITGFSTRRKGRSAVVWGLDPLRLDAETGVLNRRTILQELNSQISRSRRYDNALGVIELRIATEPSATEQARQEVAECLKNVLRWADFIGALSEESFLIVLPETDEAAMNAVAGKIRETWENPGTPHAAAPVTLEFATTCWRKGDSLDTVLQRLASAMLPAGT